MSNNIKTIFFLTFIFYALPAFSQKELNDIQNHFLLEEKVMFTNINGELFPVFNNEISLSYGLNNFIAAGIFYDFYHVSRSYKSSYFKGNRHLTGVKVMISILPLINKKLSFKVENFNFNINGYFSYKSDSNYFIFEEKKDKQTLINYYRINVQYFINSKFFFSADAGVINSNRLLIGAGIKL